MSIVLACAGQKGGNGKSLIARALAAELARQKKTVALLDLDVGQHTAADWNDARAANNIAPALKIAIVDPNEHRDFRVPELSKDHQFIILDAPGFSDEMTLLIAEVADLVILPTAPSVDDLRPTVRLYHELVHEGVAAARIVIVINRIRTAPEEKFARSYLGEANLSERVLKPALEDQVIYRRAADVGRAASEASAEGPRERALEVVSEILKAARKVQATSHAASL